MKNSNLIKFYLLLSILLTGCSTINIAKLSIVSTIPDLDLKDSSYVDIGTVVGEDKFIIIIYLINKDLSFYRKNGITIDYETFYRDKTLEIEKINISDISKDLEIPKESVRRKVAELEKKKVISKTGKKIFLNRSAFYAAQAKNTLKDLCSLLYQFNKILKKDKY